MLTPVYFLFSGIIKQNNFFSEMPNHFI